MSKSKVFPSRRVKFSLSSPSSSSNKPNIVKGKQPPKSNDSSGSKTSSHNSSSAQGKERSEGEAERERSPKKPVKLGKQISLSGSRRQPGKSKGTSGKDIVARGAKVKKVQELTVSDPKLVDWSSQGVARTPHNLMATQDMRQLILASTNLISLPRDICFIKNLEKLDLSKNGIRCNSNNDFSGLPAEMAQLTNLTELKISECNLPYVPPVIFKISSLKILNLSRNKISVLVPEIGQLINLVKLNLQQTNITSLPPEIAYCQELEEVYLWGNSLETLPETLAEMPKLRILALNYRNFCGVVDPYMEILLKKSQIKSDHIPVVVFDLCALEVLDLESTKLNILSDTNNINLRELYLSKNFLQAISSSICNLKCLRILDISFNLLKNLPEDIGNLNELKILRLAGNNIENIPRNIRHLIYLEELNLAQNRIRYIPPEIKALTALQILILAKNNIQSLPEEICELTQLHTLDLTSNEIHSLPMAMQYLKQLTVAHGFHKLEKCGLWLYKNPLKQPPPEVWRTEKSENIFEYLKKLMIIKTGNLQRLKVQLIGESQCGKTSLVGALTMKKSHMSNSSQQKTRFLQQTKWTTENRVKFVHNDFGGDSAYRLLYKLFLDSKALVMLVYNAATFCEANFYNAIGQWLDMLLASTPGAVVKLVGTQSDLLHSKAEGTNCHHHEVKYMHETCEGSRYAHFQEFDVDSQGQQIFLRNTSAPIIPKTSHSSLVHNLVLTFLKKKEEKFYEELRLLKSDMAKMEKSGKAESNDRKEKPLKNMRLREEMLKNILQNPLKVLPTISLVSSSNSLEGIQSLTDELEQIAIDRALFPHAHCYIPGQWKQLGVMLKQRKGYYLSWDDIEKIAQLLNIKGEDLNNCIGYLHNTAEVIWFNNDPGLCEIVFHKPKLLVEAVSSLFRHDITDFLQYNNKVFLCKGRMNRKQLKECADIFLHSGGISRTLLKCLWFHLSLTNNEINELLELLPRLEICFSVPEPEIPNGPLYNRPLLVLPWYNKDTDYTPLMHIWPAEAPIKVNELTAVYSFPFFCPPEIFPIVSAQIQGLVDERMDWKGYIFASTDRGEKLLLQFSKEGEITTMTLSVRGPAFSQVKALMKELVYLMNICLLKYPGLYWKFTIPIDGSDQDLGSLIQSKINNATNGK